MPPLSRLAAIQRSDWRVPFNQGGRFKKSQLLAALTLTPRPCLYLTYILGLLTESAAGGLKCTLAPIRIIEQ